MENENGDVSDSDDFDDEDETTHLRTNRAVAVSEREAIKGLECAIRWMETQDVDYVRILQIRNSLEFAKSQREHAMKQLKINHCF